jgi:hypothetical protein
MELLTSPGSDDLSALLGRINVRSVVYCLSDLGAPWGFRVDGSATACRGRLSPRVSAG